MVTSKSGYSLAANSEAEYTEAPASDTITYASPLSVSFFISLIISAITSSDSLEAVPFPKEITSTLYFLIISFNISLVPSISLLGTVGYTVALSKNLPVASNTATLHPVLKPGSYPITTLPFIGGCIRSAFKFSLNINIAPSSPLSVSSFLISLSIDGNINLL